MFHRVKSESQPAEAQKPESPSASAEVKEFKRPEREEKSFSANDIEIDTSEDVLLQEPPTEKETTPEPQNIKTEEEAADMNQESPNNQNTAPAQDSVPSSAYNPANVASSRSYPGTYPGYAAAAGAQEKKEAAVGDRRLTIGAGITMSGEIESCDYLLVEGTVEAALKGASVLDIAETGIFYGTVEIDDATIAGRFEGDITAHGRLTLREGATVTGTIAYKELEIEAGAVIDGKLTPLQAVQSLRPASRKDAGKTAGKDAKAQSPAKPEPANTDGGLFTKAAAAAE